MPMTDRPSDLLAQAKDLVTRLRRLPGIDVDAGLAFVGHSVDVYARLLARFVQLHEDDVHELVSQAERADDSGLQQLAHSIKGGAATLGVTGMASLAQQLELATRQGGPRARIVELAKAMETDHAALRSHLTQGLAAGPPAQRA
jgi:two-component system, sensor histidine kinase and response regulator